MRRRGSVLMVGAVGLVVALVATAGGAATARSADTPRAGQGSAVSTAASPGGADELPVLTTFQYDQFGKASGIRVVGAVHAVTRVEGGTALYYSVGLPPGAGTDNVAMVAFTGSYSPYKPNDLANIALIDSTTLHAYRPLATQRGLVSDSIGGISAPNGRLVVLYAVFPELPAEVDTVDLQFEFGATVNDVPVTDRLLEPQIAEKFVPFGEGWPRLPATAEIESADPARSTFTLVARTADVEGTSETSETAEQVEVALGADFFFDPGSADLTGDAPARIDQIAQDIAARGTGEVVVTGHTDNVPDANVGNQQLSEDRADAVLTQLQGKVGDGVRLRSEGRAESQPVASNATDEGRAANRRVTVTYQVEEGS